MEELRYNWETTRPVTSEYQKTPSGNYICNVIYKAHVGNYLFFSFYQTDSGRKYGLFLSVKVWKEDGCKENKVCQSQRVASFTSKLSPEAALVLAEKWIADFIRDCVHFSRLSLSEII